MLSCVLRCRPPPPEMANVGSVPHVCTRIVTVSVLRSRLCFLWSSCDVTTLTLPTSASPPGPEKKTSCRPSVMDRGGDLCWWRSTLNHPARQEARAGVKRRNPPGVGLPVLQLRAACRGGSGSGGGCGEGGGGSGRRRGRGRGRCRRRVLQGGPGRLGPWRCVCASCMCL